MPADDLIETFLTAQAAFTERVHAVAPDQWQLGTPDAQWTVADLVGHLVDEHRWAAPLLAGLDMNAARAVVAGLGPAGALGPAGGDGAGLVRAWDLAAATAAEAFRAGAALTGQVAITRGWVPAVEYLEEMVLDLIVHAWDLGVATGYPGPLPAGAVAAIYPLAQAIVDRTPAGMFDAPVDVGADAPVIDRLVALTGRRPA
jgi:uncharacterized protein (TIGR03086 family)